MDRGCVGCRCGDFYWYKAADTILQEIHGFLTTLHAEQAVFDRVLATALFTDIVDSTSQAATTGDRSWRTTRERHDALIRSELAHYRGREVKTMGDGFLATFDGPARAVRCAQAIIAGVAHLGDTPRTRPRRMALLKDQRFAASAGRLSPDRKNVRVASTIHPTGFNPPGCPKRRHSTLRPLNARCQANHLPQGGEPDRAS